MKKKLALLVLLAGSSLFAAPRVFVGIGIGGGYYAPPPPPVVYAAPAPAYYAQPGYNWVAGYWYPVGGRYQWRAGYWARPPNAGAAWVAPRYYGGRWYAGHWHR